MDDLLPHYERELAVLRHDAQDFARRYPKVAAHLQMAAGTPEDPHVERLIESFALLSARVHKRLDDDFPLFTASLLEVLYPHYLRPFPSCSIARFELGSQASQMTQPSVVPRGTTMTTRPIRGVTCRFRSAYDVTLAPLEVSVAVFRPLATSPAGAGLPKHSSAVISIELQRRSEQMAWASLGSSLRVFLDGEPSQVSVLRHALCSKVIAVRWQAGPDGRWLGASAARPALAGFHEEEALIDYDSRSHPAYRLLSEFFAFPEKFNFVDLPLDGLSLLESSGTADLKGAQSVTMHLVLGDVGGDGDEARLLESISARSLALGCTPVVNLFQQPGEPIRVTHRDVEYPVLPDARRAFGHEVYSVDKVFRVRQTPHGESIEEFRPFFSLRHESAGTWPGGEAGEDTATCYWHLRRDESLAKESPGYETQLSIVDLGFDPTEPQTDTLSIMLTATNRDLPNGLTVGAQGGDLFLEGGGAAQQIVMLRRPTRSMRIEQGRGTLWRLVSHLSLNHLSLSAGGVDALKEMLRLYDLPRDASNRRQIDALERIEFVSTTAWLDGKPFASFVRGVEVRLTLDEEAFVGVGLDLFVEVLDVFFGLYVSVNSFSQLTVISKRRQCEIFRCSPRNGALKLL